MSVSEVSSVDAFQRALSNAGDKLVVLDCFASWCGPCKMIRPVYEQIAQSNPNVVCLKVDGDRVPQLVRQLNVTGYPTFVFFRRGAELERLVGANEAGLTALIGRLKQAPDPVSNFSFPLRNAVQFSGVAKAGVEFLCKKPAAAEFVATLKTLGENIDKRSNVEKPGAVAAALSALLQKLPEEEQFPVVDLIRLTCSYQTGADALKLLNGTPVAVLPQVVEAFGLGFVPRADTSKALHNRHALALECASNCLALDSCAEFIFDSLRSKSAAGLAAEDFAQFSDRALTAFSTLLLNAATHSWYHRSQHLSDLTAELIVRFIAGRKALPDAALIRLLGAMGTVYWLSYVMGKRENSNWDATQAMVLASLEIDEFLGKSTSPDVSNVAVELKKSFQLALQN